MGGKAQLSSEFATIVADPPWRIKSKLGAGGRRRRATVVPYGFMDEAQIEALSVGELAAPNAHLYLWATRRVFREGIAARVARAWGFEPVGEVLWGLRNPGMGTRLIANDHEPILVAVRGSLPFSGEEPMGVHFWRQPYQRGGGKIHSAKPDAFLDHVEAWSPGPYLEIFARRARFGWSYAGEESLGDVDIAGLRS